MHLMDDVAENRLIGSLVRGFARSPAQVNALHESDAELVRLPGTDHLLALTADAIAEEIEAGLYDDPFLVGWMAVTAAVSDLAAVGAEPLGLLLVEMLPPDLAPAALEALQRGIGAACTQHGVAVLGGDTNSAPTLQVMGVAAGLVPQAHALTRRGARPGQAVCATGPLGAGAAFAALRLADPHRLAGTPPSFQPTARVAAGRLLREHAACCIDTSDGALAALDQLARLNEVGFCLEVEPSWIAPSAREVAARLGVPPWMMLAGLHGEFELLFCVEDDALPGLCEAAGADGWQPLRLGTVVGTPGVELHADEAVHRVDAAAIRNLFTHRLPPLDELIRQIHACVQTIR